MAWWFRAFVAAAMVVAIAGCGSSGAEGAAGAGGTGGTSGAGGTPSIKNVYISSIRPSSGTPNCLSRPLTVGADGKIGADAGGCYVVEALPTGPSCACDTAHGRTPLSAAQSSIPANALEFLRNEGDCDQAGLPACADFCFCEIAEFSGEEQHVCQTAVTDPDTQYGFCYLDPMIDVNGDGTPDVNPDILASCPATSKRILRFMGAGVPASDAQTFIACMSQSVP